MDTSRTQRHQCRHCGAYQALRVTPTHRIEDVMIGEQFSGGGRAGHANVGTHQPGDLTHTARRILSDPKQNTFVRHTNKLRRFIGWPFR